MIRMNLGDDHAIRTAHLDVSGSVSLVDQSRLGFIFPGPGVRLMRHLVAKQAVSINSSARNNLQAEHQRGTSWCAVGPDDLGSNLDTSLELAYSTSVGLKES